LTQSIISHSINCSASSSSATTTILQSRFSSTVRFAIRTLRSRWSRLGK